MNNDNPLVPQGSLLEQKNQSRSRVKTAFFCVLAVHVLAILVALIAQGCKREPAPPPPPPEPLVPLFDTSSAPVVEPAPVAPAPDLPPPPYGEPALVAPVVLPPPDLVPPAPPVNEHVVASGDSFYSLGKHYGVSAQAIADANPGVEPTRLRIGQRLNIPAPTDPAVGAPGGIPAATVGEQIHVVKSGDNLTRIANKYGVTVKALRSANHLVTDRILVGDKLKIPGKAPAPAPAPAPIPEPGPVPLP